MRIASHLVAAILGVGCGILSAAYVVLLHEQGARKPKRYSAWITAEPWK